MRSGIHIHDCPARVCLCSPVMNLLEVPTCMGAGKVGPPKVIAGCSWDVHYRRHITVTHQNLKELLASESVAL